MNPEMQSGNSFDFQERRRRIRFPIVLGARYAVDGREDLKGTGWTVNISSLGALITTAHDVPPGTSISVVMEWPILLGDVCPLALHIRGRVVRSDPGSGHRLIAVRFATRELRTQPKPPDQARILPKWLVRKR